MAVPRHQQHSALMIVSTVVSATLVGVGGDQLNRVDESISKIGQPLTPFFRFDG
ncbi:MAG: hypothetical protein ABJZ55_04425 [Fuerstiella sp.]